MTEYKYLVVGAGMTADAALRGIRELDPDGTVGMIGNDPNPPYDRPPLSKGLWKGKPLEKIWRKTQDMSVELLLGRTVTSIDADNKLVRDDHGGEHHYDKLLIATGGTPRQLPFGSGDIIYFRTLDDYHHLRELSERLDRFAVIGGSFIGSEIAAALAMNGRNVTMMFPEKGIGANIFPSALSDHLNDYYREKGVTVLSATKVMGLHKSGNTFHLVSDNRGDVLAEAVVAGIGIQPNIELAKAAGLEVGSGVLVDDTLHTSRADIFAAGDIAEFNSPILGKRLRFEHEDNANTMGKQAGRNMAGANEPYHHLPYFYSDLFDLGYEAVGELSSKMETFVDWKDPYKEGVVYYLSDGRVKGVLLWNVWDSVPKARQLISEQGPFTPESLKGRL